MVIFLVATTDFMAHILAFDYKKFFNKNKKKLE